MGDLTDQLYLNLSLIDSTLAAAADGRYSGETHQWTLRWAAVLRAHHLYRRIRAELAANPTRELKESDRRRLAAIGANIDRTRAALPQPTVSLVRAELGEATPQQLRERLADLDVNDSPVPLLDAADDRPPMWVFIRDRPLASWAWVATEGSAVFWASEHLTPTVELGAGLDRSVVLRVPALVVDLFGKPALANAFASAPDDGQSTPAALEVALRLWSPDHPDRGELATAAAALEMAQAIVADARR